MRWSTFDFNSPGVGLVDIAGFPGSTGSPIYILDENGYKGKSGTTYVGASRAKFLGVLYAGPQYSAIESLDLVDVPTQMAGWGFAFATSTFMGNKAC